MNEWVLGLLVVVVIVAVVWYVRRQSAEAAERRQAEESRRIQASRAETERAARAASARGDESSPLERGRGLLEDAAETASGQRYERAADEMEEMTAELERARQDADRAAQRLAGRADEALASIQAAAAAYGGAVPGDGTHDCPPDYPVKGNMPTLRYHLLGQPSYGRTIPEVCFQNAASAEAAGFAEAGDEAGTRGGVASEDVVAGGVAAEAIAAADAGWVPPGAVRGDGSRDCPPTYPIKARQSTMSFLEPGTPAYDAAIPELCFSSAESARAAGLSAMQP